MDLHSISTILMSLLTLTFLEIVLGVDNLVFISIASNRLPPAKQKMARRLGLSLALWTRLLLLASVFLLMKLQHPLFEIFGMSFSGKDLILLGGGLFLIFKATTEIHAEFAIQEEPALKKQYAKVWAVVVQIAILDIIFSLDSVLTAVGLTQEFWIMATAIVIAIILMMFASEPLSRMVNRYPTIRMLALSFLLLIGTILIADAFSFHIPRGYIYFAIAFSLFVEVLNTVAFRKSKKHKKE